MSESEVIIETEQARVRIMSLSSHEANDWHYHTEVTDDIFCLSGTILVRMKEPDEEVHLSPGERCHVQTGRVHRVENCDGSQSTYLLIQGIGRYDFNKAADY